MRFFKKGIFFSNSFNVQCAVSIWLSRKIAFNNVGSRHKSVETSNCTEHVSTVSLLFCHFHFSSIFFATILGRFNNICRFHTLIVFMNSIFLYFVYCSISLVSRTYYCVWTMKTQRKFEKKKMISISFFPMRFNNNARFLEVLITSSSSIVLIGVFKYQL